MATMPTMINQPLPAVQADAALYFMPDGHYLFVCQADGSQQSKFVTSNDLRAAFADIEQDSGWLGDGILRAGRGARGDWFVYQHPACMLRLALTTPTAEEIYTPMPATVLIGSGPSYYLFAVAEKTITPRSKLYIAPVSNVYSNGRICWGSNRRPAAHHSKAAEIWQLFFETPFNKDLANGKVEKYADVNDKLRELSAKNAKHYPTDALTVTGHDLESTLRMILERRWGDE